MISVLTPTVLADFPLWAHPATHILTYIPDVIAQQKLDQEVELIFVDGLRHLRPNFFRNHRYPFPIFHVQPEPYPERWTNHCRLRNAGLNAAHGEVILQLDDTISTPNENLFQQLVDELDQGWCVSPLVNWRCGDRQDGAGDWRWNLLQERGVSRLTTEIEIVSDQTAGKIGFGVMAFPRKAALAIGGYEELYDGGVQFSDNDFGVRLAMHASDLGLRGIAIDTAYVVDHEAHDHPDLRVVSTYGPWGVLKCNRMLYHWRKERDFVSPLNSELKAAFEHCPYFDNEGRCEKDGGNPCPVPTIARRGSAPSLWRWIDGFHTAVGSPEGH